MRFSPPLFYREQRAGRFGERSTIFTHPHPNIVLTCVAPRWLRFSYTKEVAHTQNRRAGLSSSLHFDEDQNATRHTKVRASPSQKRKTRVGRTDTQTGMLPGVPGSATCVQRFDDSRNSAIHITYRISLRSSSLREPRHPLLKVVYWFVFTWVLKSKLDQLIPICLLRLTTKFVCNCYRKEVRATPLTGEKYLFQQSTFTVGGYWIGVVMILPQVHLRKPCYDFTFL